MLALAVALTLVAPVPGGVARAFDYSGDPFARGHHRGLDLAARPGRPVRAACGGRVAFAGRAGANGRTVTIHCGAWSVTHLPLGELAVHAGDRIAPGTTLGTAAASRAHRGLHLGVRRAEDPLGYVDPAPLLRSPPRLAPPTTPRTPTRRPKPPPPHAEPLPSGSAPRPAPAAGSAPATGPARAPGPGSSPLAPWPSWAGLALLIAGATGAGAARARRRGRSRAAHTPRLARAPDHRAGTVSP